MSIIRTAAGSGYGPGRLRAFQVEQLEDRVVPAGPPGYEPWTVSVGLSTGDPDNPVVTVAVPVPTGRTVEQALAEWRQNPADFDPAFTGKGRTAAADFNEDGVNELVVATGPGSSPAVRVLDGITRAELAVLNPFESGFTGGLLVAAGDVTGDGVADVVVAPDVGGGPRVRVFSGKGFVPVADFFGIEDPGFRGGVRPAVGDFNADGADDLVVAAGAGGGPRVAVFDGTTVGGGAPDRLFADFFAFAPDQRSGAFVAAGDVTGDGPADLVAGSGPGGDPHVRILSGAGLLAGRQFPVATFLAGEAANRGGVLVAVKDVDGDVWADVITAAGDGGRVTSYAGAKFGDGVAVPAFEFAYAEPNFLYRPLTAVLPSDPLFGLLYAENNTGQSGGTPDADVDAPEAWALTTGSPRTTVAVLDTGVDYTHPDLYLNVWINQAETPATVRAALTDVDGDGRITFRDLNNSANIGPGKITDLNGNGRIDGGDLLRPAGQGGWADKTDAGANGYVDDLIGWDFVGNDNDPIDVTAEGGGHGTHVAGTVGAVGNNGVGVAGVAWATQLMPLRFLGSSGGTSSAAAAAIRYAAANGAVVSNNSWGGPSYSQAIYDAIDYARRRGQVFVAAAGNDGSNNDAVASYPGNYALDNVVAVAATDRSDRLAGFSNYGRTTVDLAAPGVEIASAYPGGQYVYMSGTSMAAPHVSGAFALLLDREPSLSTVAAIGRVVGSVDPLAALGTVTVTGGRLNVYRAVLPPDAAGPFVTAMTPNRTGAPAVGSVRVTFSEAIDPATFTAADVSVTGPTGAAMAVNGVAPVGTTGTGFDVTFARQSAAGLYTVRVGPDVRDSAGNRMDQDRDGVNGEAGQDQFAESFLVAIPAGGGLNRPPVAGDDTATVAEDAGPAAVNVLANDADPDADPLAVVAVTQGQYGAVVITGGAGLTYAPAGPG